MTDVYVWPFGRTDGRTYGSIDRRTYESTDRRTEGLTDGQLDGHADIWTDLVLNVRLFYVIQHHFFATEISGYQVSGKI